MDYVGDGVQDGIGNGIESVILAFLTEDGGARFKLRGTDFGNHSPLEPGAQSFLDRFEILRRAIARHHDLIGILMQFIEGVKEFLLRPVLALQKLDIVN